jgi:hypothetical protein
MISFPLSNDITPKSYIRFNVNIRFYIPSFFYRMKICNLYQDFVASLREFLSLKSSCTSTPLLYLHQAFLLHR